MTEQKILSGLAIGLIIVALLLGGLLAYAMFPQTVNKTSIVEVPVANPYNDTIVVAGIAELKAEVLKDSNWKATAESLATEEGLSTKDVYNFLVDNDVSIEDKGDIKSITETDSDVDSFDVDEKDAVVVKEYKVIYEDQNEVKNVKKYLIVTTEIVDGEVTEQVINYR
jgi:hypothetical protein